MDWVPTSRNQLEIILHNRAVVFHHSCDFIFKNFNCNPMLSSHIYVHSRGFLTGICTCTYLVRLSFATMGQGFPSRSLADRFHWRQPRAMRLPRYGQLLCWGCVKKTRGCGLE